MTGSSLQPISRVEFRGDPSYGKRNSNGENDRRHIRSGTISDSFADRESLDRLRPRGGRPLRQPESTSAGDRYRVAGRPGHPVAISGERAGRRHCTGGFETQKGRQKEGPRKPEALKRIMRRPKQVPLWLRRLDL